MNVGDPINSDMVDEKFVTTGDLGSITKPFADSKPHHNRLQPYISQSTLAYLQPL